MHAEAWREVEEVLISVGMAEATAAVAEAQQHELVPADVEALVAHWRLQPGRWGVGGLRHRIAIAHPGMAVDACWPPASEAERRSAERSNHKYFERGPVESEDDRLRRMAEVREALRPAVRNGKH
jgi:hypothetical protein